MVNTDQQHLLTQMGITTWQSTIDLPGAKRELKYACYRLNHASVSLIVEHGKQLNTDENTLLDNMLRSVGLEIAGQVDVEGSQETEITIIMPLADDFIDKIGAIDQKTTQVTHPIELLNGANKREAWHSLVAILAGITV